MLTDRENSVCKSGKECGESVENQSCTVDCVVADWLEWSSCAADIEQRTRSREASAGVVKASDLCLMDWKDIQSSSITAEAWRALKLLSGSGLFGRGG